MTSALRDAIDDVPDQEPTLRIPATPISPQAAEGLLRQPLYGDLPGLGPAFSVSYAPLAPEEVTDG